MWVDIIVEELAAMETHARPGQASADLAAKRRVDDPVRRVDRHMNVDVRPNHQVIAGAAGHHRFAEFHRQEVEESRLSEKPAHAVDKLAGRARPLRNGAHRFSVTQD